MRQRHSEKGSFLRVIRRQPGRLLALTGLGLLLVAVFASAAAPQGTGTYTASVSPSSVAAGDSDTFTVTITNTSSGTEPLGSARIRLFTVGGFPITSVVTSEPGWSSGFGGGYAQVQNQTGNPIPPGSSIDVDITATAPTFAGTYTWPTSAWEANDFAGDTLTNTASDPQVTVTPGPATSLDLSAATTTPTAGVANNLTITAKDTYGNTATSYTSTHALTFGGASPAGTQQPVVSDNGGGHVSFTVPTNINFTNGVATVSGSANGVMTLYKAESTSITVTDGSISNGTGLPVTVAPGPLDHFTWTDQPNATQTAGVAFDSVAVTAYDQWDNVKTNYNPASAVFSGNTQSPSGCASDNTTVTPGGTFGCDPIYGFSWSSGVATSTTLKTYNDDVTKVSVSDASGAVSINGFSNTVTIAPGPLDRFQLSDSANPNDAIDTQTAGAAFTVYATAFDPYGNAKTDYPGGLDSQTFSGLLNSPAPSNTPPSYGAITWASGTGQGSASITAFRAGSQLTLTDFLTGKSGTSTFTVLPGPLYRFRWTDQPNASQTAGVAFDSVAVTAYDQWDNVKTNYNPAGAVFSGLAASARGCASGGTTVTPGGTVPCNPVYGFIWTAGVATSATVKGYKAQSTQLTVTDGSITAATDSGSPDTFTIAPNEPDFIAFVQQPTLTQFNTNIAPPVTVNVEDAFGNATPGKAVTMTIATGFNPSGGTLTGGGPFNTDGSGIATFSGLKINNPGVGYKLNASVPTTYSPPSTRNINSVAFDIANQVTTCTGNCTATGSTPNSTAATVDAFGLTSGALNSRLGPAVSTAGPARLGMTVASSVTIPSGVCTGPGTQAGLGDGFWITTFNTPTNQPSFKIVATLAKKEVQEKPGNPGATKFDICLAAINVNALPPPGALPGSTGNGCTNPATSNSWPTKDGSCAKFANGYYWGLVPDYPSNKAKSCPTSPGSNLFPGMISRNKTGSGDVVDTFCKPYPWDGGGGWR